MSEKKAKPPVEKPYKPTKEESRLHEEARDVASSQGSPTLNHAKAMIVRDASEEAIEKLIRMATMLASK